MTGPQTNAGRPPDREGVARPAALVSAATLSSRVAGLAREALFGHLFGRAAAADAFVFAFRIPNLFRDLFAEGALSPAFVPVFTKTRAEKGDAEAFRLAGTVLGTLLAVTGALAALGIVFAEPVVSVVASDATGETRGLAAALTRIMFPFLPLVAAAAVLMGVLNAHGRYVVPALAPAAFNVVAIAGGSLLVALGWSARDAVVGWAAIVLLGGLAQALVQVPPLLRLGYRGGLRADLAFRDGGLRTIVRRMGPVAVALAGTQVMLVITTTLASRSEGWAAALNYAFRLIHLPIGLVGVAVGTVALAAGSRRAAAGDAAGLDDVQRRALRLNWFVALPAAVGLAATAEPVVRLIFEHGAFDQAATALVVEAVRWYALGVVFYGGTKVAASAFHARGDTRTPMACSLLGIAASLAVAVLGIGPLGFLALPLATAAGSATNYGLLRALSRRRHGPASGPGAAFLAKTLAGAAAIGAAAWAFSTTLAARGAALGNGPALVASTLAVVGGLVLVYLLLAHALGIEEGAAVVRLVRRGGNRGAGAPPAR
jgi:putative peptidoglycan lipid II flippase